MATSGSYDFTMTRDALISAAFRKSGISSPSATDVTNAAEALNLIIKSLIPENTIWCRAWTTKTLSASSEVTGTDGNIYTCTRSHTSTAANRPITGADWTTYWKLGGSTGGAWVITTAYSAIGDFTVATEVEDIVSAYVRSDDIDYPLTKLSTIEYFNGVIDKYNTGLPYTFCVNKTLAPITVYLYFQPDSTDYVIHYLAVKKIQDFDAASDNPDFPVHWFRALMYLLASEIAPDLQKLSVPEMDRLEVKAERLKNEAISISREKTDPTTIVGCYEVD